MALLKTNIIMVADFPFLTLFSSDVFETHVTAPCARSSSIGNDLICEHKLTLNISAEFPASSIEIKGSAIKNLKIYIAINKYRYAIFRQNYSQSIGNYCGNDAIQHSRSQSPNFCSVEVPI